MIDKYIVIFTLFSSPMLLIGASSNRSAEVRSALKRMAPKHIKAHVEQLGHDRMQGRAVGTPGGDLAADYIAKQLQEFGLETLGGDSYFQPIPMHGETVSTDSKLRIQGKGWATYLELEQDYLLYNMGEASQLPKATPLVFAGYGIVARDFGHNDYQNLDVEGAVVVMLSGEPEHFSAAGPTHHGLPQMKQRVAVSRGALGSIIIPTNSDVTDWDHWRMTFGFEHVHLSYEVSHSLDILFNPDSAKSLFKDAPYSLDDLIRLSYAESLPTFPMNTNLAFEGVFKERDFRAHNVAGLLRGSDPELADTYVLVTAHYDHLGIGPMVDGDNIYNGVVDNALGVAGVLEMARVLTLLPGQVKRSVVFLFLTGEEKGLLGSLYYTEHPLVPIADTIANVNVDGLAITDLFKDVVGVGAEYSTLGDFLSRDMADLGIDVTPMPDVFKKSDPFSRSDQLSFAQAGIPSILISEGFQYLKLGPEEGFRRFVEWGRTHYHKPTDDLNQNINYSASLFHARLITAFVCGVANRLEEPRWRARAPWFNAQDSSASIRR